MQLPERGFDLGCREQIDDQKGLKSNGTNRVTIQSILLWIVGLSPIKFV